MLRVSLDILYLMIFDSDALSIITLLFNLTGLFQVNSGQIIGVKYGYLCHLTLTELTIAFHCIHITHTISE